MKPKLLVLYELNEFALYKVTEEVGNVCPIVAALGDVKDAHRLIQMPTPDIVFHCAAYKHVPLLEGINSSEAYRNNVNGTEVVMTIFDKAQSIVLLSTDKAVNPAGVMGASKLEAEKITRAHFRTVARLGNILESSGSVVPKFRAQIEAGGPVTVTHKDATRYFLPMDEAVDFLLSCSERHPGTYTAEMGSPVNILDLAIKMIGGKNIEIQFTGLRPGEKLHEELA